MTDDNPFWNLDVSKNVEYHIHNHTTNEEVSKRVKEERVVIWKEHKLEKGTIVWLFDKKRHDAKVVVGRNSG